MLTAADSQREIIAVDVYPAERRKNDYKKNI